MSLLHSINILVLNALNVTIGGTTEGPVKLKKNQSNRLIKSKLFINVFLHGATYKT